MIEISEWWGSISPKPESWLIYGKGPSFARRHEFDASGFRTIAMNHSIREMRAFASSTIDLEVVRDCGEYMLANSEYLILPRYPHVSMVRDQNASDVPLEGLFNEVPVLRRLSDEGRLVWYSLSSGPEIAGAKRYPCLNFSSEVLFEILGDLGAKRIWTIGIEGGGTYAADFNDLFGQTFLSNTQSSYDIQFRGIARAVLKYNIDYNAAVGTVLPQVTRQLQSDIEVLLSEVAAAKERVTFLEADNARLRNRARSIIRKFTPSQIAHLVSRLKAKT